MSKFQVCVRATGSKTITMVKALRLVANLGLKEATELSDHMQSHTPCVLIAGVGSEVAEHACELLREAGAEVAVEASSLNSPMLLCPKADYRYRWSGLWDPTPM